MARKIADLEATTAESAASADAARQRLGKIDKGEEVSGGLGKPILFEDVLHSDGWTTADIRHAKDLAELSKSAFEEFLAENGKRIERDKGARAIARAVLKRQRAKQVD